MPDPLPPAPSPQGLKAALKAFKKRLKLTCLDNQSRIGVGPMSSGRPSASWPSRPRPVPGRGLGRIGAAGQAQAGRPPAV